MPGTDFAQAEIRFVIGESVADCLLVRRSRLVLQACSYPKLKLSSIISTSITVSTMKELTLKGTEET